MLPSSAELYQIAFAACPAGFIVWNADLQVIDWNPAAERIFGWTHDEATAQPSPCFLLPPHAWSHFEELSARLREAGLPSDSLNDNVTKDGQVLRCKWHNLPLFDAEGHLAGFVSTVQDLTSYWQAEEALRVEIKERQRAEAEMERVLTQSEHILGAIASILISVDERGVISTWNRAAANAFGFSTPDRLGRAFTECGIAWDHALVAEGAARCMGRQTPVRLDDVRYLAPDGRERYLGVTLNPINSFSGEPKGFLLLAADITDRRVLQGQVAHAQKMESIGQLAAGIAHEINTPIQYVGDNTRFLRDAMSDLAPLFAAYQALVKTAAVGVVSPADLAAVEGAEQQADLEYLRDEMPRAIDQSLEGISRVSNIVRAMKEFSHPGTAEKVATDLNRALDSTLTVASNEWKYVAELVKDFDPNLPMTPCLPADLNQVFLNMIVNAAHAIADVVGEGGGRKGVITVRTRSAENAVEVEISDTGKGMTEEVKARIFDPFFTTKEVGRGTGQGLAISHAVVVEKHGGTITVESAPGQGTTFRIRLPLAA